MTLFELQLNSRSQGSQNIIGVTILSRILFCILFLVAFDANASAWVRKKGTGQTILSYSLSSSDERFFIGSGKKDAKQNSKYYNKNEQKIYSEFGVSNKVTVGFSATNQALNISDVQNKRMESVGNSSFAEIFARRIMYQNDKGISSSLQILRQIPIEKSSELMLYNYRGSKNATELKYSIGYSFGGKDFMFRQVAEKGGFSGQYHFVDFGFGYRNFEDSFYDEVSLDATLGVRQNRDSLVMIQYFVTHNIENNRKIVNNPLKKISRKKTDLYDLNSMNQNLKISSIIRFSEKMSTQLAFSDININSYGNSKLIEMAIWYDF